MSKGLPANDTRADDASVRIIQYVEQAQGGDKAAFHRLADRFYQDIFRMIYYRTRSKMDAEDLAQDVFLRAYKNIGRLQYARLFRSWLYRIAVNRVRDYYRSKKIKSVFSFTSTDEDNFVEPQEMTIEPQAANTIDRREFWEQVGRMLENLSKMEREVFLLRFFDDLTIKEITAALKKSESAVKTHLYRALKKMRTAAEQMDGLMEVS